MNPFKLLSALIGFFLLAGTAAHAKVDEDSLAEAQRLTFVIDSIHSSLKYQTGMVKLPGGIATLNVPPSFKYLGKEQSNMVITELWGNPKRDDILGMLFPSNMNPLDASNYGFIVSYEETGFIKDEDADEINYKEMLTQLQEAEPEENKEREKNGYPSIHMVGWAQQPFYDKQNKVLHWAKELQFGGEDVRTLNYDVRILGRKGVLSLNAVGTVDQLPVIKSQIAPVLSMAKFEPKFQYKDFDPSVDKVAAYGIGALVAGKVLAKVGFFALILKFWKLILAGFVAVSAGVRKFLGRKKQDEHYTYAAPTVETVPATENETSNQE